VAEETARSVPNGYRYKINWMESHKGTVETLILGNSHAYNGIVPSKFKNAFNLSMLAQPLEYDAWLLDRYIRQCPNLHTIVLVIDSHNLFLREFENRERGDWYRAIYYNLYMGYPRHGIFSKYHYEISSPLNMFPKLVEYLKTRIKGEEYLLKMDSLGLGQPKDNSKEITKKDVEKQSKRADYNDLKARHELNLKYLTNIMEMCEKYDKKLNLVSLPYYYLYNEYIDPNRLQLMENSLTELKKKGNICYVDYRTDERFTTNMDYFWDSNHLNIKGAEYFTDVYIRENF